MIDEIGEWRMRAGPYFVMVTFNAQRMPCILIADVQRGVVEDAEVRRVIFSEMLSLTEAIAQELRSLEKTTDPIGR